MIRRSSPSPANEPHSQECLADELTQVRDELQELTKANAALQETVDALATMPDLGHFIPAALRIVARAFNIDHCSYFEHSEDGRIQLKYWLLDGRVLSCDEIFNLEDKYEYMKGLARGFTVEDAYFGMPFQKRTRASVIDHGLTERNSHVDIHCRLHGWYLELNVPLVVNGSAVGELVVQRGPEKSYTPTEIALGERLATQLTLAMQVSRLSVEAKGAAVAREKERAALEHATQVENFSAALRRTLDSLVCEADFLGFVGCLLQNTAEQMQSTVVEYWRMDGGGVSNLVLTCRDGRIFEGSDVGHDVRSGGVRVRPDVIGAESVAKMATYFLCEDVPNDPYIRLMFASTGFDVNKWCEERNVYRMIGLPLMRGNRTFGLLNIYLPGHRELNQAKIDLAQSFAQQLALSLRLAEFAEESKQAAVVREREVAAQSRADEISRFSEALRKTLDSLVDGTDFPRFTGDLLRITSEQLQAPVVEYWKNIDGETVALSLTCRDGVIFQGSDVENDVRVRGIKPGPEIIDSPTVRERKTHFIMDDLANDPRQKALFKGTGLDMAKWCRERGVHRHLNLPLFREGHYFGALALYLPENLTFDQPKIDVAYSFSQQLALSIRLTELAEESKQAAVLREREAASQTRAVESATANAVLRSTLEQLAENRDLHSFPRTILREAMKQLNAEDGALLLLDPQTSSLRPSEIIASGPSSELDELMAYSMPAKCTQAWQSLVGDREPVVLDMDRHMATLLPGAPESLRVRLTKSMIAAPLFLRSDPYGYFAIALPYAAEEISKVNLDLVRALTQQANLAIQLIRLAETSKQSDLALERQQVIIQERAHMAREIHDKLAQGYAAILMQQHAMRRSMKTDPEGLKQHLDIIERLSKDNIAEARRTMDDLRVDPFGLGDLQQAMEACKNDFDGKYGFNVTLEIDGVLPAIPRYLGTEICRLIGEALTNARKHSRATAASVAIKRLEDRLIFTVKDDGIGFDADTNTPSFGIASMHERAARAGGELIITSALGSGTQVLLSVGI